MDIEKYKSASKVCVAPMMDWTDRHCRYFHRLLSPHARLYTEMVTTGALIHGDRARFLAFDPAEQPVALQLGGSDPAELARCTRMAADWGYDEVNLNCGCPSDRVQSGRFGACLMLEPEHVARCFTAMQEAAPDVPVTIKCRIGVDDQDEVSFIHEFVRVLSEAGCRVFIIHARKAFLKGLSPKENRDVPPLRYDVAKAVKDAFPGHVFILNGGIKTTAEVCGHLEDFDGVMVGREAYQNPWVLSEYEAAVHNPQWQVSREDVVAAMTDYIARVMTEGVPPKSVVRHMLGLYQNMRGARQWRQFISQNAFVADCPADILMQACAHIARRAEAA